MASFESMSDVELRKKLVEYGYDIPVAGNRDFIVKKLTKLQEGPVAKGRGGRKSTTPVVSSRPTPTPPPATNNGRGGTPISRLSLNDSGQGQRRSASRDSDRLPPPAATPRAGSSRRSVGSAVETASNKSNSSATGRPQRNSLPPQAYSAATSSRLRQVAESVEDDEEESSSEEDSVLNDSSLNGDHDDHVEDMEVEDQRPSGGSRFRAPTTPYRSSNVTTNSSFSRTTTTTTAPTSFSTTKSRAGLLPSTPYSANTSSASASSSRFEKYYNYFRNNTDSSRDGGDPLLYSYSRTGSPGGCMSPSSTAATVGSPSFNRSYPNTSFMSEDCSADEEEEDFETEEDGRPRRWISKLNPLNLVRGLWRPRRNSEDVQTDLNSSAGDDYGGRIAFSQQTPVSRLESAGRYSYSASPVSGIQVRGPASAAVAHHLYPPTRVPPAVAAGRQAGFQMFSSRGERNGVVTGGGFFSDWTNIPKLIVLAIFALFAIIAISYCLKSVNVNVDSNGFGSASPARVPTVKTPQRAIATNIKYCLCGTPEADPEACVLRENVKEARDLVDKLKSELVQRATWKGCSDDDKLNFVSAKKVAVGLMGVSMDKIEAAFTGALILINENPNYYGLIIESNGMDEFPTREVLKLNPETSFIFAAGVKPNFRCLAYAWISNVFFYLVCFAALGVIGYLSYKYLMARQSRQMREEEELFQTVQEVIEMLQEQQERAKGNNSIEGYLAINHIRDTLIPPQDRKKKEALWKAVANHISTQESRVREEVQHLSGEEYQVWRWMAEASPLPSPTTARRRTSSVVPSTSPTQPGSSEGASPAASPKLYPSLDRAAQDLNNLSGNGEDNLWQGQAFEVNAGSPNALMKIPSTCLKIRQMYDPARGADEERRVIIGRAIQQKCGTSKILHIGIDPKVSDGSVYLLCQSKEDARAAFSALHGWWFEGNLLSVKFLREERYFERFPDARSLYVPSAGISGQGSFRDQLRTGFN